MPTKYEHAQDQYIRSPRQHRLSTLAKRWQKPLAELEKSYRRDNWPQKRERFQQTEKENRKAAKPGRKNHNKEWIKMRNELYADLRCADLPPEKKIPLFNTLTTAEVRHLKLKIDPKKESMPHLDLSIDGLDSDLN